MGIRILGSFAIIALLIGAGYYVYIQLEPVCAICRRPVHKATYYRIVLEDEKSVEVCCPRCGLHFQRGRRDVTDSQVADFSTGERFPADEAHYVENSSVHLCCATDQIQEDRLGTQYTLAWDRCLPSLVAFRNRDQAVEFSRQKGGLVKTYTQLLQESKKESY